MERRVESGKRVDVSREERVGGEDYGREGPRRRKKWRDKPNNPIMKKDERQGTRPEQQQTKANEDMKNTKSS